jgi:crotonobetainyl-CoA:carnitine CoA-transferase CaiB-like acyl-CoA transferase
MTNAALAGLRIVDLSRVLAGPYCTMLLADLGADVIKIEHPIGGDDTRQWGPPWLNGQSAYYLSVNRNKRSMTLNLKHPRGQVLARRLISMADVLVENFKVGAMEQYGLDYAAVSRENPRLVYCSITGYGQTGPDRDRAGYDFIIQAEGGVMSITGPSEGPAYKVGVAIVDITAGLYASQAILAALHYRERTGRGQYIDVALLDAQVAWLANVAQNYMVSGEPPRRYGNAHPNIVPYETFETADGYLALGVGNDRQYQRLCELAGRPDLWADVRFRTNADRVTHRAELIPLLQEVFRTRPTADWIEALNAAGIPIGPINDVPAVFRHPQVIAREMRQTIEHPLVGTIPQLGPVAKLSETPASIYRPPPLLGEHTRAILRDELDCTEEEIAHLQQEQVIGAGDVN